jgi:hypothetical protein
MLTYTICTASKTVLKKKTFSRLLFFSITSVVRGEGKIEVECSRLKKNPFNKGTWTWTVNATFLLIYK